jgi:SAM-dependent MidA family methyltransferase
VSERLDHFFARANEAYYGSRDPLREFTTSPEISQIFGELLGAFAVDVWARMGNPDRLCLIEAGPGRGTLMADIWRIIGKFSPAMAQATKIFLIETSPKLREIQAARLPDAVHVTTLEEIPPGPTLFFANEFLDALPIRQFVRGPDGWRERFVENGAFALGETLSLSTAQAFATGAILEINPDAEHFAASLAARLLRDRGAGVFIDYGYAQGAGADTLQALFQGKPADPLKDPGSRDLTAHVDFAAIARAARAARVFGPVTQRDFLGVLGIEARAQSLARQNPALADDILAAVDRLIAPTRMGVLFKVLAVAHPSLNVLPGF